MKYRLKNQELQKQLDEISDGDFSRQLEAGAVDTNKCASMVTFGAFNGWLHDRFTVRLNPSDLEKIPEYNPNDWNKWPDVTPPEKILMRCVIKTPGRNLDTPEPELPRVRVRAAGFWNGRDWEFDGYGSLIEGDTVEYRPWE